MSTDVAYEVRLNRVVSSGSEDEGLGCHCLDFVCGCDVRVRSTAVGSGKSVVGWWGTKGQLSLNGSEGEHTSIYRIDLAPFV